MGHGQISTARAARSTPAQCAIAPHGHGIDWVFGNCKTKIGMARSPDLKPGSCNRETVPYRTVTNYRGYTLSIEVGFAGLVNKQDPKAAMSTAGSLEPMCAQCRMCALQGANEIVPSDSEGSGKWGLGGNEGVHLHSQSGVV